MQASVFQKPLTESALRRILCAAVVAILAQIMAGCINQPVWRSGFENGYPGNEWLDLHDDAYAPDGNMPRGRVAAWTIVGRESGEPIYSGQYAYKGWITGPAKDSHRAYPVVHADLPTPLINSFMVYLDVDYGRLSPTEWIHFAGWGNHDPVAGHGNWILHTMSVRNRKLEFAHTSPFHGEYIGAPPQPDFPLRRWVRLTAYIVYAGNSGFVQVWQDGKPVLRARIPLLRDNPGTRLRTAHWGMYAPGSVSQGVQYKDDIRICTLSNPLTELVQEPACPQAQE